MTYVKRLLDEATPLPWRWDESDQHFYGWTGEDAPYVDWAVDQADRDLIVYAVNRLPAHEAAEYALARLLANAERIFDKHPVRDWGETLAEARAALARLREKVPA